MNGHIAAPPAIGAAGPTPWRAVRSLCRYAVAAVVATAFFFWLHHLGNGIPYELAQQRFAAAPLTGESDSDIRIDAYFEHCQIASMVLAGAREKGGDYGRFVDAVLLRGLTPVSSYHTFCAEAKAASVGANIGSGLEKFRYWWGGKALFAIALHWLSVVEFYRLVYIATGVAWLLFCGAMAMHGPRALTVALPLVAFGFAFAGGAHYSGPANGLPYMLAVASAAMLALLLANRRTIGAAAPFCFAVGLLSSYLWLFDGHNFLVIALFGLVVWLAREGGSPSTRARRGLRCIAFYAAGFAVCVALGQVTKAAVFDGTYGHGDGILNGSVVQNLLGQTMYHMDRVISPEQRDGHDLTTRAFVAPTPSMTTIQGGVVIAFSVFALAGAALGAGFLALRRSAFDPAWTCLWFLGLMLAASAMFVLPNDQPPRSARYLSLLLALCWASLAAVASHLWGTRGSLAVAASALIVAALPGALVLFKQSLWRDDIEAAVAGAMTPVARADFDVYLANGGRRIIYVKENCVDGGRAPWVEKPQGGWHPRFFLYSRPKGGASRDRTDFKFFGADFAMRNGSQCVAMKSLPSPLHNLKSVETGQSDRRGTLWSVAIEFTGGDLTGPFALCGDLAAGRVYGDDAMTYAVHVNDGESSLCSLSCLREDPGTK